MCYFFKFLHSCNMPISSVHILKKFIHKLHYYTHYFILLINFDKINILF
ncbi:hypothetical protein PT2222_140159 [Paraburkholderia tropica]